MANVRTPGPQWTEAEKHRLVCRDLYGGTVAMREAGERWLPKHDAEDVVDYQARLDRTFLLNAYRDTVDGFAARAFRKPVTLAEGAPAKLEAIVPNVAREGRSLGQFAHDFLLAAIHEGLAHILVDFPEVPEGINLAEERALGARPFFVLVPDSRVIGVRSRMGPMGETLTQVRILETSFEPVGEWEDQETERVRVLEERVLAAGDGSEPTRVVVVTVYRKVEQTIDGQKVVEWEPGPPRVMTIGRIPLVSLYTARRGFMQATPALEDLAWMNLAHWQSGSDQRQILGFARRGILFGAGFNANEIGAAPVIGNRLWRVSDPNASLQWVEHTGGAIGAGRQDLLDLEERMVMLGLRPLLRKQGQQTATESMIETAESNASLASWLEREAQALDQAFELAAEWAEVDGKASVQMPEDPSLGADVTAKLELWLRMRERGDLSRATFYELLQSHDLMPSWFKGEAELVKVESEDPLEGDALGGEGDDGDEDARGDDDPEAG